MPQAPQQVLVQAHCHHKSIMGMDAEEATLSRMGTEHEMPATGCCGLAGSWGFEQEKYDVSMQCGERVLFPAVRQASPETAILADGFSCRTQIAQGTDRRAIHLAQFIESHLDGGEQGLPRERPEQSFDAAKATALPAVMFAGTVAAGVGLALTRTVRRWFADKR
jgi:hypothetical protein